jgi:GT2 family glycosyltransferase
MEAQPLVSIITIAYNRPKVLQEFLKSVYNSTYKKVEVVVVNNSKEEFKQSYEEILKEFPEVRHVWSEKNLLISGAWNLGLKEIKGDLILFCGDDYVLDANMIKYLVESLLKSKNIGIAGPILYHANNNQRLTTSVSLSLVMGTPLIKLKFEGGDNEVDLVDSIIMAKKEVVEKIGNFDERNFPFYLESADLCTRARQHGYKCVIRKEAKAWHEYVPLKAGVVADPDRQLNPMSYYFLMKTKIRYIRKYARFFEKVIFFSIFLPLLIVWHFGTIVSRSRKKPITKITYLTKGIFDGIFGHL